MNNKTVYQIDSLGIFDRSVVMRGSEDECYNYSNYMNNNGRKIGSRYVYLVESE